MVGPEAAGGAVVAAFAFALIFGLIISVVVFVVPFWFIFKKAGYPGALSLLMIIPLVNIVMFFVLAFSEWPALRELQQLRAQVYGQYPPQSYPQQYPPQTPQ